MNKIIEAVVPLVMCRLDKRKEYEICSAVNSASLHPDQDVFVCGGEDCKMYKCDFTSGSEQGNFVCTLSVSSVFVCSGYKVYTVLRRGSISSWIPTELAIIANIRTVHDGSTFESHLHRSLDLESKLALNFELLAKS